ncbi:MAG: 2-hydroxyhepta-2,4-diene-1,7-dioate isomerase [Bacteroidetes bacterium HGW-Bacteroidetes-1]|jgi:2-keto-4-pentenoate hydratase/2-oxohepta-3-ene-1,7-dioic acid hydratase in catechol pathway|nr:MAG: 2-hydroxyhepta-2,4-diene-1,7-dioate isomerase [Bacteroidetes bacterium HGW-Bacteroidetes-1]
MKIICIGRNYVEHAKELNNPVPDKPVFFMKPDTSLLPPHNPFFYPDFSTDIHYEVELVLKVSKTGRSIAEKFAHNYYDEIGIGIDFTARDLQTECKKKGLPWEIAKAFDFSAPIGRFLPKKSFTDLQNIDFGLKINDEWRQRGNSRDMIFSFEKIIAFVSQFVMLRKGDYIFTGTPEGVGPARINDHFELFIGEENLLAFNVK